jgi:hypothetical protein
MADRPIELIEYPIRACIQLDDAIVQLCDRGSDGWLVAQGPITKDHGSCLRPMPIACRIHRIYNRIQVGRQRRFAVTADRDRIQVVQAKTIRRR